MSGGAQPLCLGLRHGLRGLGAARDGRGGALRQKSGARRILPSHSFSASNGHPEVGGDGPALGLPCPLSSFRFLARRPFSPWLCFLFFIRLRNAKAGEGKRSVIARSALCGGRRMVSPALLRKMGRRSRAGIRFEFHRLFAPKRIKKGRGREFFGVFPTFFKKSIAKISSPPIILAFRE